MQKKLKTLFQSNFNYKMVCLSETWCQKDISNTFQLPNYTAIHRSRNNNGKGGGVCISVHNSLVNYKLRKDHSTCTGDYESLSIEIINNKSKIF